MRVQRQDIQVRWVDARSSIVLPAEPYALLVVPPNAPLDPVFRERLELRQLERVLLQPDDIDPYFDVFEWSPAKAIEAFLGPVRELPEVGGRLVRLPVSFGEAVELLSYEMPSQGGAPGDLVPVITTWRVLHPSSLGPVPADAYGYQATIFVHLLDKAGAIIAQDDRLDAPAWAWRSGDVVVQLHRLALPPELAPGWYRVAVGVYTVPGSPRLPASSETGPVGDHVLLPSLEVSPQ
jgi:hypothetical protein